MAESMSRRDFVRQCAVAGAAAGGVAAASQTAAADGATPDSPYQNFFGDLHNHNHVGYARGSLRRTFEIARNHLDFFAFTPHAYWPDIGHYDGNIENKWLNGFHVAAARWPEVVALAREFDAPGRFATILVLCHALILGLAQLRTPGNSGVWRRRLPQFLNVTQH